MPPHPLSSVSVSLADDYASDDDREYVVNTPPPPSPSCPSTPIDADMTDDVSVNEDLRPVTPADGQRAFKLAPISSASHKDITLPPLQDLIADVCRDCELERSRRASWDTCHSRVHPRHLYAGGDGMVLHAQRPPVHPEVAVATPRDPRRHTVHGPLVPPQYIFYPSPPPAASRPRYASHIPTWTCSSHTSQHSDPRADQRSAYGAAHEHSRLHPDFEFADYSLSSQSRNIAYLHPEAAVDPRDATFTPRHQDARRQSLPQTWRRTHVDSRVSRSGHYTTLRRTSDDEATPSSPDLPLTRTPSPSPFQQPFPRRQSLSRPYPSPHAPTTETSTRRSSSAQPARRHVIAKGRPQPLAQQPFSESSASPHSTAGSRKRGGSVTSDVGTVASASSDEPTTPFDSNATRPPSKQHPFNDLQVTELSDKYLLQLHPRPKKILCQWKGGCSRWIHAPLTASVVAHLQTYHGVGVRERGDDGIQCCWGGKCGRMLKACSMRNHILNSHEKIKTGDCKLCGSAISRAETYLMHRHLTSCLNKIAREGDLDARLRGAGVVIIRDPETGEISFSPAPGAPPPRTLAERKDAYDDDMDDLPPSPTPVPHERPLG